MPDYDPDMVVRKWKEAYRRFYLYRPKRVWEKVSQKSFWTELPSTMANAKRFFLPEKVAVAGADRPAFRELTHGRPHLLPPPLGRVLHRREGRRV